MENSDIKRNIEVGRRIFENIPSSLIPAWAGLILSRFSKLLVTLPKEIETLFEIIDDETRWIYAHNQFTKIRKLTLLNNDVKLESYLLLAEQVAKATYNLSHSPAPFDKDSGWHIPSLSVQAAEYFENADLKNQIQSDIFIFSGNQNLLKDFETTRLYLQELRNL